MYVCKYYVLQRKSHLWIPFLGIARPQSQFPHLCVYERFVYSQDRSTSRIGSSIDIQIAHRHVNVETGRAISFSGNISFEFALFPCHFYVDCGCALLMVPYCRMSNVGCRNRMLIVSIDGRSL
jgi:hypothetical protein